MIQRILKIAAYGIGFIIIAGLSAYFTLSLIIKSEDTVIVPDFIGKDVVYVLEYLTDLGLNTKVKGSEYSAEIPKNHVIYQEPDPGVEIKKGRDVKIFISRGTKTIFMPNLNGMPARQARIILEENDLCRGVTVTSYDTIIDKDAIIAQAPLSGTEIPRGECVDLLVSLGPRPQSYKMPDLKGQSLAGALLLIEKSNLVHGNIQSQFFEGKPRRRIVAQEPLAGYRVTEQSPVNLVVNRRKSGMSDDSLPGMKTDGLLRHRIDNGFLKRHIRVQLMRPGFSGDLFDDFVRPGEEIWLIIPTDEDATVLLYEDDQLIRTLAFDAW